MYGTPRELSMRRNRGMLNIVSFLIITIITLTRMKSGYASNPLLDAGTLVLTGYILSLGMVQVRLHHYYGFIFAGILLGRNGLGFIQEHFAEYIALFETVFIMFVVSKAAHAMFTNRADGSFLRSFLAGVAAAIATFFVVTAAMLPLAFPTPSKIIFGLLASLFPPLVVFSSGSDDTSRIPIMRTVFGGFTASIIMWGIATAVYIPHVPDRIKIAFMPVVIGVSSVVAGFVWGFIAEKMIFRPSPKTRNLHSLASMLLLYPLIKIAGFDFIFLAIGIGIYNGLVSERTDDEIDDSHIFLLIVFTLFGTKLSLENAVLLGKSGWIASMVITAAIIIVRTAILSIMPQAVSGMRGRFREMTSFMMFCPMSIIVLKRFLPGFQDAVTGGMNSTTVYAICTMSIILTIVVSCCLELIGGFVVKRIE